ncbi:MAG: TetR/AcrR family transcriptional regulator [Pseudobdellovibrionaceae bacterium]
MKKLNSSTLTATIYRELFPPNLSKAEARKIKILEAAIKTYSDLGIEYVSYEDIAREAKTSRPLVQHHFPDKRELFLTCMRFIRAQYQELAVKYISQAKGPQEQLIFYIRSTLPWLRDYRPHVSAWLFYFYLCCGDKELRAQHRELTEMGFNRIVEILRQGSEAEIFSKKDHARKAKAIQQLITGVIMQYMTENEPLNFQSLEADLIKNCLELVA